MSGKEEFSPLEIYRVLVLSTAHLQESTARAWDEADAGSTAFESLGEPVSYGYQVWTGHSDLPGLKKLLPEVWEALALARRMKCAYVRYDCDGPVIENLKEHIYSW